MKTNISFMQRLLLIVAGLISAIHASASFSVVNDEGIGIWYEKVSGGVAVIRPDNTTDDYYLKYTSIKIPTTVSYEGEEFRVVQIAKQCFSSCIELQTVILPESLSAIGDFAFKGCISLEHVDFPSTLKSIGQHSFENCTSLQSIVFPSSLIHVGMDAFNSCSSLEEITIPSSVISIGYCAFASCYNLKTVISHITNPKPIIQAFLGLPKTAALYVPAGTKEVYQNTEGWNDFKNIEEMNPTTDGEEIILLSGMQTYCSENTLDFSNMGGLQAFIASGFEERTGEIWLSRIDFVPANTGVILRGIAGQTYNIPFTERDFVYSNLLVGVAEDTEITEGYVLTDGLFEAVEETTTVKCGTAYLKIPATNKKQLRIRFTDTLNGVEDVKLIENSKAPWFTINGTRLNHKPTQRGIYLNGGKKVMVK